MHFSFPFFSFSFQPFIQKNSTTEIVPHLSIMYVLPFFLSLHMHTYTYIRKSMSYKCITQVLVLVLVRVWHAIISKIVWCGCGRKTDWKIVAGWKIFVFQSSNVRFLKFLNLILRKIKKYLKTSQTVKLLLAAPSYGPHPHLHCVDVYSRAVLLYSGDIDEN